MRKKQDEGHATWADCHIQSQGFIASIGNTLEIIKIMEKYVKDNQDFDGLVTVNKYSQRLQKLTDEYRKTGADKLPAANVEVPPQQIPLYFETHSKLVGLNAELSQLLTNLHQEIQTKYPAANQSEETPNDSTEE